MNNNAIRMVFDGNERYEIKCLSIFESLCTLSMFRLIFEVINYASE